MMPNVAKIDWTVVDKENEGKKKHRVKYHKIIKDNNERSSLVLSDKNP